MNFDFTYYNPTKIHFGKDSLAKLSDELKNYGKNILLMYGKGSVKKSGLYDKVIKILSDAGKSVTELPGIKSNPTYEQLMKGAELVRENDIDLILAVGGGSVGVRNEVSVRFFTPVVECREGFVVVGDSKRHGSILLVLPACFRWANW